MKARQKKMYTPREVEIAALKVKNPGISQAEVASRLGISPQAVSHHVHSMETKWTKQQLSRNQ